MTTTTQFPSWAIKIHARVRERNLRETTSYEGVVEIIQEAQTSMKQILSHHNQSSNMPSTFTPTTFDASPSTPSSSSPTSKSRSYLQPDTSDLSTPKNTQSDGGFNNAAHTVTRLQAQIANKDKSLTRLESIVAITEKKLNDSQKLISDQTLENKNLKTKLASETSRVEAMERKLEFAFDQSSQITSLTSKVSTLSQQVDQLKKQLEEQEEENKRTAILSAMPGSSTPYSEFGLSFQEGDLRRDGIGWNIKDLHPTPPRARCIVSSSFHLGNATVGKYLLGGHFFASGGSDGVLRFHSSKMHTGFHSLSAAKQAILTLGVSPDTKTIAFGGVDKTLYVCPSTARVEQVVGLVHEAALSGCAFMDSEIIVSTCNTRADSVRIWNVTSSGAKNVKYTCESAPRAVTAAPKSGRFVTAHLSNSIQLWQLGSSQGAAVTAVIEDAHDQRITSVVFSPDETSIASTSWDSVVRVRDTRSPDLGMICELYDDNYTNKNEHTRACYSPDGRFLIAGDTKGALFSWDLRKPNETYSVTRHTKYMSDDGKNAIIDVDWNENGKQVAAVSKSGRILFFEHAAAEHEIPLHA